MKPRLQRRLRQLVSVVIAGGFGGMAFNLAQGRMGLSGLTYGLLIAGSLGGLELLVMEGPARARLASLPFSVSLAIRSVVYAAVIIAMQWFEVGEIILGLPRQTTGRVVWSSLVYSAFLSILFNLVLEITNLIGRRALLNFITGRYHHPVEENRFVLFVDIAGSTGLAERLGGIGIHRLLDRTFRLLTEPVVDYHGEVLNYVGDEVIVTWPETDGAIDSRPLRCFLEMRAELTRAAPLLEREFGAAPRIRGSLHFGPVIIGEIGDVKRAIVFNGDTMNTAARLEELSRGVDGGFIASRAAIERFASPMPFAMHDLGQMPIRGRIDGIEVVGLTNTTA